jgi:hypothetical protein
MAGHSRPKDGVAPFAYARPSTSYFADAQQDVDAGTRPGMTSLIEGEGSNGNESIAQ